MGRRRADRAAARGRATGSTTSGLLPAPFPLDQIVGPDDLRWIKLAYGIGGLSYGNMSVRKDADRFWMSASGVDKSNLREIGRDVLMVKDYDPAAGAMVLSVPPGVEPRRVSVDAIEHYMIYREHPTVGAIVHVHAWISDVTATEFNYPCGTRELATAVSDIVREAPDPGRTIVGPQEPRTDDHRPEPRGDLRADRTRDRGPGPDECVVNKWSQAPFIHTR